MTTDVTAPAPAFERVRHPFKARHLQLLSREQISPGFLRLTLVGESWTPPASFEYGEGAQLQPLRFGEALPWKLLD